MRMHMHMHMHMQGAHACCARCGIVWRNKKCVYSSLPLVVCALPSRS